MVAKAGDQTSILASEAEWLVKNGYAEYPQFKAAPDETVQATLDRANTLMDSMGLPHLDQESFSAITESKTVHKKLSRHYAKPADKRLARDIGLSPDDFADMKQWAKGK